MRLLLLLLVGTVGCSPDADPHLETTRAFVRRSGPTVDTLRIARGAERVDLAVEIYVVRGRVAWTLRDADDREVWHGTVDGRDTVAAWTALDPAPGDWQIELRPDSAIGTFALSGDVR